MGWVDSPHLCDLPTRCHSSIGKYGDWFECDVCHSMWQVVSQYGIDIHGFRKVEFKRRSQEQIFSYRLDKH